MFENRSFANGSTTRKREKLKFEDNSRLSISLIKMLDARNRMIEIYLIFRIYKSEYTKSYFLSLFPTIGRRSSNKSPEDAIRIDDTCIVKQGYLVKSPPLDLIRKRVSRWHMRWFVLYDTKPRCDVDPAVDREVELLYYRNNESQYIGDAPLGKWGQFYGVICSFKIWPLKYLLFFENMSCHSSYRCPFLAEA